MRIRLDGRALTSLQVKHLLEACGFDEIAETMAQQGYTMRTVRAPRRFPANGILRVRFIWAIRDSAGHALTVRLNGTVGIYPV